LIRATARADDWFDLTLFRVPGIGIDLRYHAALPGPLVGAGLLFTFLGLAIALGSAGGIIVIYALKTHEIALDVSEGNIVDKKLSVGSGRREQVVMSANLTVFPSTESSLSTLSREFFGPSLDSLDRATRDFLVGNSFGS
jgi:hypothetical protein